MTGSPVGARHANQVTQMLDHVLGRDRYPVNVAEVALQVSMARFPDDPIERAVGDNLPGLDGALLKIAPDRGWAIVYNNGIKSGGRINFTLAHEFGHYLIHRQTYPKGFNCSSSDITRQDSGYRKIELEANEFSAYLLMPLHDFRTQIEPTEKPDWEKLSRCAARYDVSLIAATLRWLEYTSLNAVLAVSRDGYIDWGKSSNRAFMSGHYFTKRKMTEVPQASPAAQHGLVTGQSETVRHAPGSWFCEAVTEMVIRSDAYDFTLSLLLIDEGIKMYRSDDDEEEPELDLRP